MVLPFYSRFCNNCWDPHFGELYEDLVLVLEFMTSVYLNIPFTSLSVTSAKYVDTVAFQ